MSRLLEAPRASAPIAADALLKATSLLYLRDALEAERYEECASLIASAKSYGASESEISNALATFSQKLASGRSKAYAQRRRFS